MKRTARALALLLMLSMVLVTVSVPAAAYTPKYTNYAEALYDLGLFQGAGTNADGTPDFALDETVTREQAVVMLLRLLGQEEDALAYTGRYPFTDVPEDHWARPYIAYAYACGYTSGMTFSQFGLGEPATVNMYLTFILRALGYSDTNGDFYYSGAATRAVSLGIIPAGVYDGSAALYRDDCAYICYNALMQPMANRIQTLARYLSNMGVIPVDHVDPLPVLPTEPDPGTDGSTGTAQPGEVPPPPPVG